MHRVQSADGTQIAVWQTGTGPPLLLVHGTTADHTRWSRVSPLLGGRFTVFALDRRGRGESGDVLPYAVEREAEDVAAVAKWIGARVSVLGHSYGAICTLEAALRTPVIGRMVLYEPPIPVGLELVPNELHETVAVLIEQGRPEEALLVFFREVVGASTEQIGVLRAHPAWPARVAAAHTLAREMKIEANYQLDRERFGTLETPTTMLLGTDSPVALKEATRHVHELLPCSEIVQMVGQQHIAMDMIPEEFAELVVAAVNG